MGITKVGCFEKDREWINNLAEQKNTSQHWIISLLIHEYKNKGIEKHE